VTSRMKVSPSASCVPGGSASTYQS
jgi:hypothetical protein